MAEIRQWLMEFYIAMCREPFCDLFSVLRGGEKFKDLTVAVVNHARSMAQSIGGENAFNTAIQSMPTIAHDKAILDLYYKLLYGIIAALMQRKGSEISLYDGFASGKCTQRLSNVRFHRALLLCAAEVVAHAFQGKQFPTTLQSSDKPKSSVDIWIVMSYVLESDAYLKMPRPLIAFLKEAQRTILMRYCFMHDYSVYMYLLEGGGCLHLPGEMHMVSKILLQFAYLVLEMMAAITQSYAKEKRMSQIEMSHFVEFCQELIDRVLFRHLYLFFRRSILVPIVCCVFSTCKLLKIDVRFNELLSHGTRLFPALDSANLRNVLITAPPHVMEKLSFGSICSFYNSTFLTACQGDIDEAKQRMEHLLCENEASFDTSF